MVRLYDVRTQYYARGLPQGYRFAQAPVPSILLAECARLDAENIFKVTVIICGGEFVIADVILNIWVVVTTRLQGVFFCVLL